MSGNTLSFIASYLDLLKSDYHYASIIGYYVCQVADRFRRQAMI